MLFRSTSDSVGNRGHHLVYVFRPYQSFLQSDTGCRRRENFELYVDQPVYELEIRRVDSPVHRQRLTIQQVECAYAANVYQLSATVRTFIYLLLVAGIFQRPRSSQTGPPLQMYDDISIGSVEMAFLDALHQTTFFSSLNTSVHFGKDGSKSCCEQ